MNIREIIEQIDTEILLNSIAPELKAKSSGQTIDLICPICLNSEKSAYIYKNNPSYINCHRQNNCGNSTSVFDLLKKKMNFDNKEAVNYLKKMAGIEVREYGRENFIDLYYFNRKFRETLFSESGKAELEYLKGRGYTTSEIKKMELGSFRFETLCEKEKSFLYKCGMGVEGLGVTHTLSIPFRDSSGIIKGFAFRSLLNKEELKKENLQKYKNSYGLKTSEEFFNMNRCRNEKSLILVEGYMDALYLAEKGVKGVVACGKAIPSDLQINNAVESGVENFIFALDMDNAGQKAVKSAIFRLDQLGISSKVIETFKGFKDPDELVRAEGIDSFVELLNNAVSSYIFLAGELVDSCKAKVDAVEKGYEIYSKIKSSVNRVYFTEALSEFTSWPKGAILKDYNRKETASNSNKVILEAKIEKELYKKLKKYIYEKNLETIDNAIEILISKMEI